MKSITGIEKYDRLAKDSPDDLNAFIEAVKQFGWIVKATSKLPAYTIAQFFPRKRRFYFDPQRMSILDMMHEQQHLEAFKRRGNWKTLDGQVWRDELEAYSFEFELGRREGFSTAYMDFLHRQIEYYRSRLSEDDLNKRSSSMPDPFLP
jgi:hypothetical protein